MPLDNLRRDCRFALVKSDSARYSPFRSHQAATQTVKTSSIDDDSIPVSGFVSGGGSPYALELRSSASLREQRKARRMLRVLERTVGSLENRLILLAPPGKVPTFFRHVETDSTKHRHFITQMQKLRGHVYLDDGAVQRHQLSSDGLHQTPEDDKSWHLLTLDERQRVTGCAWYLEHDSAVGVDDLRVRHCPLAKAKAWRTALWNGVEAELARARREYLKYAEVGGWAVAKESRCTSEGLLLALAGYSLGRICGGCLGLTTATVRHCSSSILRRLGGSPLEASGTAVPSYYDPKYDCQMEILRFDSRKPNAKYADVIELLREKMANVKVIALPPAEAAEDAYDEPTFASWSTQTAPA